MKIVRTLMLAAATTTLISTAALARMPGNLVSVSVVANDGSEFSTISEDSSTTTNQRNWLVAKKGAEYSLQLHNLYSERVGVVVSIDGRNAISGKETRLDSSERMYVLEPYSNTKIDGWRTSMREVHRFVFTSDTNSYANRQFKDNGGMGVIAVAVYREKPRPVYYDEAALFAGSPRSANKTSEKVAELDSAGTGFGRSATSHARSVDFEPYGPRAETHIFRYEWEKTLCKMGVISCSARKEPYRRLWDEQGFAPHQGR